MADDFRAGYQVLRLRKLCGCSQEELAAGAGISTYYLRRIEHGDANPSVAVLLAIFSHLYTLVTGQEDQPPTLFAIDLLAEDLPMWRYRVIHETGFDPEVGAFPTCSVVAESQLHGVWTELFTLHDVTLYEKPLQALIQLCNHLQLSPLHLRDAVEAVL